MDAKSIRAYARAERLLMDALDGAGANMPENMFDKCCENPPKAFVQLHKIARANGLITPEVKAALSAALWDVDPEEVGELDNDEQGTYVLAWYAAAGWEPNTLTVSEAAREAGVTPQAIRKAIEPDPGKVGPKNIYAMKPKSHWLVDRDSFERWMANRE